MKQPRKTLGNEASLEGKGLHTGKPCRIVFAPAKPGSGLRFIRKDLAGRPAVRASLGNVRTTVRGTNLGDGKAEVFTVEHVLSACAGIGIDDLDIIMDGPEPPAMDGSACQFAGAMLDAGIKDQPGGEREFFSIDREITYAAGKASYRAGPSGGFEIRVVYSNPHPLVGRQELQLAVSVDSYMKDIAPARTFGFQEEIEKLRAAGLAQGGSLDNSVIVGSDSFLTSPGGLRFADELVRHKALDLLGDLMLTGRRPGNIFIEAVCGGHLHNVNFARLLSGERQASGIMNAGEEST